MYHVYSIQYLNETSQMWEVLESGISENLTYTFANSRKTHKVGRDQRMVTMFIVASFEDFNDALHSLFAYETRPDLSSNELERRLAFKEGKMLRADQDLLNEIDKFAENSAEQTKKVVNENLDDIIDSL